MAKSLLALLNDWLLALAAALGSLFLGGTGIIKQNHTRSSRNERRLVGDPDDPNNEGVLQISKRNEEKLDEQGEKIDNLDAKVDRVLERVEALASDEARRYNGGDDD